MGLGDAKNVIGTRDMHFYASVFVVLLTSLESFVLHYVDEMVSK